MVLALLRRLLSWLTAQIKLMFCKSCSLWVDNWSRVTTHVTQRAIILITWPMQ